MKYLVQITRTDFAEIEMEADSEQEATDLAFEDIQMGDVDFETYENEVKVLPLNKVSE